MKLHTAQELTFIRELREAFQQERISRGVSQKELAKRVGQNVSHIYSFEAGDTVPSVLRLRRWCLELGTSLHKITATALKACGWRE